MQLAVDASTLVGEALRKRGRSLIRHAGLELFIAIEAWNETQYELGKRADLMVAQGRLTDSQAERLLSDAMAVVLASATLSPGDVYADRLVEAQWRVPRDPKDAPTVALALALNCGIWTNDRDFFGCGAPVWVTETLLRYLETAVA